MNSRNNNPRLILAKMRHGDYAHAGDTEAIDMVLDKISSLEKDNLKVIHKKILDVGCGLGGTAQYVKEHTNYEVYGMDIDESLILPRICRHTYTTFLNWFSNISGGIEPIAECRRTRL